MESQTLIRQNLSKHEIIKITKLNLTLNFTSMRPVQSCPSPIQVQISSRVWIFSGQDFCLVPDFSMDRVWTKLKKNLKISKNVIWKNLKNWKLRIFKFFAFSIFRFFQFPIFRNFICSNLKFFRFSNFKKQNLNFVQTKSRLESGFDLVQTKSRFEAGVQPGLE